MNSGKLEEIEMTTRIAEISPQVYARIGGVLYLIIIVLGAIGELFIRGRIVVPGDATATAVNLRSMESLWRFGIASELFLGICTITLALILYVLLRPVSRDLALLATFFNLVAIAVETAYSLQLVEALFPLGDAAYLKAFTSEQLYAMSSLSIKAHGYGFGILYVTPGLSYLTSSFALILAPTFANRYYFVMAGPAIIGETSLCLWLLVKGVDLLKWEKLVLEAA